MTSSRIGSIAAGECGGRGVGRAVEGDAGFAATGGWAAPELAASILLPRAGSAAGAETLSLPLGDFAAAACEDKSETSDFRGFAATGGGWVGAELALEAAFSVGEAGVVARA